MAQETEIEVTLKEELRNKSKSEEIKSLINATNIASTRSRKIVLLLVFTSVIAFAAYWNSRPSGWPNQRFQVINKAYEKFILDQITDTSKQKFLYKNGVKMDDKSPFGDTARMRDFLEQRNINTVDELEFLKKVYFNIKENTFSVKIPILGVSFDINDLGLFSGITFSLLLFILWFCLEREWENLQITFKEASQVDLKQYYKIMSMSQVFTVPARENRDLNILWLIVPKILYLLPLFTQLLICLNDIATSSVVNSISEPATTTYNLVNIISIVCISVLTITTIVYVVKIDLLWNKYHNMLSKKEKPIQQGSG